MSFTPIESAPGSRDEPLLLSFRRIYGKPRVRLSFHPSLVTKLGWQLGTLLRPMVGQGSDAGLIRVEPAPRDARGFLLRKVPKAKRFRLEFMLPCDEKSWASCEPSYREEYSQHAIVIQLPWHTRNGLRAAE